jgi:hypothetical protein
MPLTEIREELWPGLPLGAWQDTHDTLWLWSQIVGKIKLRLEPMVNHWWQVPFYVSARGLTTLPIPYAEQVFQMDFDLIDHVMNIMTEDGEKRSIRLRPRSVADFYHETMYALRSLGIEVSIWTTPVEVPVSIPFELDTRHCTYDRDYALKFWKVLVQADRVMQVFRSRFIGKDSPVHFFWGGFDIAVSRFSGRRAPEHAPVPGLAHYVTLEAYSHEVSSCGFWPGAGLGSPAFYAYAYPEPEGFKTYPVEPREAYYHQDLREFILPYDAVRSADSPDNMLLSFFQSTYEAAACLGKWDRASLERDPRQGPAGVHH